MKQCCCTCGARLADPTHVWFRPVLLLYGGPFQPRPMLGPMHLYFNISSATLKLDVQLILTPSFGVEGQTRL